MTRWPHCEHGLINCACCGGCLCKGPWIELIDNIVCDGKTGHIRHRWPHTKDAEKPEGVGFCGPIVHPACVPTFIDGLMIETELLVRELRARGELGDEI